MNRKMYSVAAVMMGMMTAMSHAGQASTSAHASNIGGSRGGTAGATANYNGAPGGVALTRTDSHSGKVNHAQGLAIGLDRDGLDLSFSHAIASKLGPAYAGTFNMSIGTNGAVSSSYGGVLSSGGVGRSAEASGSTRSDPRTATATAAVNGSTSHGGQVIARTNSYSRPAYGVVRAPARSVPRLR